MTEYKSSCVYVWPEPCPSCSAKDAELTRLREAVERLRKTAMTNPNIGYTPVIPLQSDPPGEE